jgi:MarR family transcriptional regulator, temperature-dependent positive regulator of motility
MTIADVVLHERMLFQILHRITQRADAIFSAHVGANTLTPRQFAVLLAIAMRPSANQNQLCQLTGIDRSTLSDIVRRLVVRNLVARHRTRKDARAVALCLTEHGASMLERADGAVQRASLHVQSLIPPSQRQQVITALHVFADALDESKRSGASLKSHSLIDTSH